MWNIDDARLFLAVGDYLTALDPASKQEALHRIRVIFGPDNRVEISAAPPWAQTAANSVAAIWQRSNLTETPGGFALSTKPLRRSVILCRPDEVPFSNQPVPSNRSRQASAFVVKSSDGAPVFLTARHCVEGADLSELVFLFGFQESEPPALVAADNVFGARRIVKAGLDPADDWAIIEPDKPIPAAVHPALRIAGRPVQMGHSVFVLGFPLGLPMKFADHALVRGLNGSQIKTDLDTAKGNSGSPVFSMEDGRPVVTGIVRATPADFVPVGKCRELARCQLEIPACAAGTVAVSILSVPDLAQPQ